MHRGSITLAFNGEIYNHQRLRHNLKVGHGAEFRGHCDTETLAYYLSVHGITGLSNIDGMFAFAAWDRDKRKLYIVRDRIGKKPLYYYWDENRKLLLFGSEIKAILANELYPKEPNWEGLHHYLSLQYVPEPMTAFKGIQTVPPGHYLEYDPREGTCELHCWYQFKRGEQIQDQSQAAQLVRNSVTEAVISRLESDVPLGVYLSGGIDSSIIAGLIAKERQNVHTFTMGFRESAYDESPFASEFAERLGTNHHEETARLVDLPQMAERIVHQYDQPFGDCSAIPTMLLCEASKKYITVALSGDGGDEAFGGYPRYAMAKSENGPEGYLRWMTPLPTSARDSFYTESFVKKLIPGAMTTEAFMLHHLDGCDDMSFRDKLMYLDMQTYLLNDIIVKMERASMAASVEVRCPFLDHHLLETAFCVPADMKIRNGEIGKYILKDVFGDVLPMEIIARQKRGFSVPINEWFRQPQGKDLLADMVSHASWPWGVFEGRQIANLIEGHVQGKINVGHGLWILLMFDMWMRRHFG